MGKTLNFDFLSNKPVLSKSQSPSKRKMYDDLPPMQYGEVYVD